MFFHQIRWHKYVCDFLPMFVLFHFVTSCLEWLSQKFLLFVFRVSFGYVLNNNYYNECSLSWDWCCYNYVNLYLHVQAWTGTSTLTNSLTLLHNYVNHTSLISMQRHGTISSLMVFYNNYWLRVHDSINFCTICNSPVRQVGDSHVLHHTVICIDFTNWIPWC